MKHPRLILATAAIAALALGGCGDDGEPAASSAASTTTADGSGSSTTAPPATTTTAPAGPLRILVTNDDGYDADGIDALVQALRDLPDVEIRVVAPLTNQSGTSDTTSPGELEVSAVETKGGYPAVAVVGYPADSVNYALDELMTDAPPDLVVSGSNEGQNLGILVDVSGTVGAARTAARRGIPALAVSQGLADPPDYAAGVGAALEWIIQHRAEIVAFEGDTAEVWNINAPSCVAGEVRGVLEVPAATVQTGDEIVPEVDCTVTFEDPVNDTEAFKWGFITLSEVGAEKLAA
jgi:5'-nucleotidase